MPHAFNTCAGLPLQTAVHSLTFASSRNQQLYLLADRQSLSTKCSATRGMQIVCSAQVGSPPSTLQLPATPPAAVPFPPRNIRDIHGAVPVCNDQHGAAGRAHGPIKRLLNRCLTLRIQRACSLDNEQ